MWGNFLKYSSDHPNSINSNSFEFLETKRSNSILINRETLEENRLISRKEITFPRTFLKDFSLIVISRSFETGKKCWNKYLRTIFPFYFTCLFENLKSISSGYKLTLSRSEVTYIVYIRRANSSKFKILLRKSGTTSIVSHR